MRYKIAFLMLVSCLTVLCQEMEVRSGQVVVATPTVLLSNPQYSAPVLQRLNKDMSLRWIDGQRSGSFIHVIPEKGSAGWVAFSRVRVVSEPPAPAAPEVTEAAAACAESLDACPVNGCADEGTTHALENSTKRRIPSGDSPIMIDFADLSGLQSQADTLVGQGGELSADDRGRLSSLTVANGTVNEGSLVRITAFLAAGPLAPHPNTGESVNCRLKKAANNDFHINIVATAGAQEFEGIVVEMIPQNRPDGWTLPKLAKLQQQGSRVLVTGALFYDNAHFINPDPNNDIHGQPRRFTLWEVHPIIKFQICNDAGGSCDPNSASDWTDLENTQ